MQAQKNTVITMHYVLTANGETVEDSRKDKALKALLGHGMLLPGMEEAIMGHAAGDRFEVALAAKDAYGERRDNATMRVSKKYFQQPQRLRPGMTTVLNTREHGQRVVTVLKVGMSVIDIDTNHPMAGKDLHFDVELVDVREATKEEIAHHHVHE